MLLLGGGVSSLIFSQMAPPLIISLILRGRMFEYDSGSAKPSSREQFRCVRAIAPNSLRSAAVNVSAFAVNHVNTLLLVKHTSLSEVASYGLLNQITMMVFGFGWVLQTNITAKMVKLRESGDCEGLVQTFGLQWFRGMLIYVASASVCAVFLGPVMALIQSQTHAPKVETILLLFAFRANEFSLACFGWLLMSENRVPFPGLTVATSFIGVFLAWEGLATFGLNGMIVGSGVSNAMLSFFFYPAGTKSIRTTFPKFAKESIVIFLQSLRLLLNRPRGY
jgi:O-antigen/teichoic acid export membrane protein